MAYLSKKELCEQLIITEQYLNMNIKRGKVIVRSDKLIDDTNPYNSDFIKKRIEDKHKRENKVVIKSIEVKEDIVKDTSIPKPVKEVKIIKNKEPETLGTSGYDLDRQKKLLEIEKAKREIELKEILLQKQRGEVIPVDVINGLVSRLGKNYVTSFKNEADKYLTQVVNRTGADRETANKLKGDLIDAINNAIKETLEITAKELEAIVKDYTVSRK